MTSSTHLLSEPQEVADVLYDMISEAAGELGIGFVGLNENLRPEYPAVVILPGAKINTWHATHTFEVRLEVQIYVYHAKLNSKHATRTRDDLQLCTDIENLIHSGEMNLDGQVIQCFVQEVHPRRLHRPTGEQVVGTQMIVFIRSQKGFPYAP